MAIPIPSQNVLQFHQFCQIPKIISLSLSVTVQQANVVRVISYLHLLSNSLCDL